MDSITNLTDNLLHGDWQNLLNTKRYPQHPMISPLNVASHCWIMNILAIQILDEVFNVGQGFHVIEVYKINAEVHRKIALHDMEECIIGDIPRHPKLSLRETTTKLKKEAIEIVDKFCFNRDESAYGKEINQAKQGTSGMIVEYVDMLSAMIEAIREKSLGNTNMDSIIKNYVILLEGVVIKWAEMDSTDVSFNKDFTENCLDMFRQINIKIRQIIQIHYGLMLLPESAVV